VLVNNAGLALGVESAQTNVISQGQQMLDTNTMGVIAMTRAFLPGMIQRNCGHVINMGSIAGSMFYGAGSMYCASKAAVQAFTFAAQHDLKDTPVRMTLLSPGLIGDTEFSLVRFSGDSSKQKSVYVSSLSLSLSLSLSHSLPHTLTPSSPSTRSYDNIKALHPDDVADDVVYAATRPAHVQIADIKVFATNQSGPKDVARVGDSLGAK
jgi:NADP-dependent 3-hydroxy acid dehydrogenase YdfG